MELEDRHLRAGLCEVNVIRERLGLVRLDERNQIFDSRLHLIELPRADIGAVDDEDRARHRPTEAAHCVHSPWLVRARRRAETPRTLRLATPALGLPATPTPAVHPA